MNPGNSEKSCSNSAVDDGVNGSVDVGIARGHGGPPKNRERHQSSPGEHQSEYSESEETHKRARMQLRRCITVSSS
jgi:hypothetical protein